MHLLVKRMLHYCMINISESGVLMFSFIISESGVLMFSFILVLSSNNSL